MSPESESVIPFHHHGASLRRARRRARPASGFPTYIFNRLLQLLLVVEIEPLVAWPLCRCAARCAGAPGTTGRPRGPARVRAGGAAPANKVATACWALAATSMLMGVVMVLSNGAKMLEAGDELVFMHNKGQGMP